MGATGYHGVLLGLGRTTIDMNEHAFVDMKRGGMVCTKCGVRIGIPPGETLDISRLPECTGDKPTGKWPHYLIDTDLWAKADFKRRSTEDILRICKICETCDKYDGHACTLIGKGLAGKALLGQKMVMATEGCPLGKWEAKVVVRGMPWKPYRRPSVLQMVRHYALAIVRWIGRGRPVRSRVEVEIIWRICTKCSYFDNGKCRQCGCRLSDELKPLSNKIAMATEHCPKGKW